MDDKHSLPSTRQVGDCHHDRQLLREIHTINEQMIRRHGILPPGNPPPLSKRKPQLPCSVVPPAMPAPAPSDEDTPMQWKNAAAMAALATGTALAACSADGDTSTPVVGSPAVASEATESVEMPPVEAAPQPMKVAETTRETIAQQSESEPEHGPAIPAAQLRRQILELLGSFQTLKDLERENVERRMQVALVKRPNMDDGYQYFGTTTEGWGYRVGVSRLGRMEDPPTILIDIDEGVEPLTDQQPTYCTLEFESLAQELVAMGYGKSDALSRFKGNDWWNFRLKTSQSTESIYVMAHLYQLSQNQEKRYCIEYFEISGE